MINIRPVGSSSPPALIALALGGIRRMPNIHAMSGPPVPRRGTGAALRDKRAANKRRNIRLHPRGSR